MTYLGITLNGLENFASEEIKEVVNGKIISKDKGKVIFSSKKNNFKDLRSVERVLRLIKEFNFNNIGEFEDNIKDLDFSSAKDTFRIDCNRVGEHEFNSVDVGRIIGDIIFEKFKKKVDFKQPGDIVYVDILNDRCFIGIDLTGRLSKRDYRIKVHASSINACLAYCMLRLSNLKDNEVLLDPFCGDGIICIEAGFYKKCRVIGADKREGYLKSCRINAKIAKVNGEFVNYNLLDDKINEGEVDKVVSNVPCPTRRIGESQVERIYKELFSRLSKLLKKNGVCIFLCSSTEQLIDNAKKYDFRLIDKIEIKFKDRNQYILRFEKDLNKL